MDGERPYSETPEENLRRVGERCFGSYLRPGEISYDLSVLGTPRTRLNRTGEPVNEEPESPKEK